MAVYTDISDEDLTALVAAYDIGEVLTCKGIAEGVENSNFLLATTTGMFILTLYEKRVDPKDLPFFLGLMQHLSAHDFECPVPIAARNGETLTTCAGRPAAIISFLQGQWPRRPSVAHCRGVGQALARLHVAGQEYPGERANDLSVAGWQSLVAACLDQADTVQPGLAAAISQECAAIVTHWPTDLPRGIIHADAFPDNVFFRETQFSGMIDYYFACTDILAYDVAICLNAWCFETDGQFNITKANGLLSRYHAHRPLSEAEQASLPLLCRGAALRFLLTRLYDWINHPPGAFVTPKDPLEYLYKLNFHQNVISLTEYGWSA